MVEKIKNKFINKKLLTRLGIGVVLLMFGTIVGSSLTKGEINDIKVNFEKAESKLENIEDEILAAKEEILFIEDEIGKKREELKDEDSKLDERKEEVEEAFSLVDNKESLQDDIKSLENDKESMQSELEDVKEELKDKKKELEKIENTIVKKEEDPIELVSGVYIIGEDVPAGRYQATNVGRGSNFFVYTSAGDNKVNTILGDGNVGSGDYVFFGNDGDIIETNAQVKLIPVE